MRILLVTLLAAGLTACSGRSGRKVTFVWGKTADATRLDPAVVTDGESVTVLCNIFDTLVAFKEGSTEIVPWLATSWETSDDGLVWTFALRAGVKFHDGSAFDAGAVVFSFERQRDPDHPAHTGPFAYYADNFKALRKVEAVDARTVRFTLSRPDAAFFKRMGLFSTGIVSPAAWKSEGIGSDGKYRYNFARRPVGTGPFVFDRWERDVQIILRANPEHFAGRPGVDRLIFRPIEKQPARLTELEAGGIHGMDNPALEDLAGARRDERLQVLEKPGFNVCYLALHTQKPPFDDVRVRQAVAWAIDKRRLIESAYSGFGRPAPTMCPATMWGHLPIEDRKPDLEKARALLREAGHPHGFETTLWFGTAQRAYLPNPTNTAIQIQQDLKQVGIRVKLNKVEWSAYIEATQHGRHEMAILGWMADIDDPDNFLYVLMDKENARVGSANNISFYQGEEVHRHLKAAQRILDPGERLRHYHAAQRILFEEVPTVPLVTVSDYRILRR
ncbi:MAG: ABC transporter substrate-binding protein, partial [Planctomycetota bacterium]